MGMTERGMGRKAGRAREGTIGAMQAQKLMIGKESQALETGAYEKTPEELEQAAALATQQIGATQQAALQAMGPIGVGGPGGPNVGKTMEDVAGLQEQVGETVSKERMSTRQLEREISEKKIADAKARITQAHQFRANKLEGFANKLVGGALATMG